MPDPGATAAANQGIGFLFTELVKHIKEWKNVREDCDQLRREFDICVAFMEDVIQRGASTPVVTASHKQVHDLAHDIEDCIERFMYRITCKDEERWHRRKAHAICTWRIRRRFTKEMKKLNKRSQQVGVDQIRRLREEKPSTPPAEERNFTKNPLCIEQAKQELLTLLGTMGTEPTRRRVISIVGFGGSGKTTLAYAAYNAIVGFGGSGNTTPAHAADKESTAGVLLHAWVNRTEYTDLPGLLKIIIEKIQPKDKDIVAQWSNNMRLTEHLRKLLENERYIIVLDDMNMIYWSWIEEAFPDNGRSSRIMVIVTTLSAAKDCSSSQGNCYGNVYQMRTIGDEGSKRIACLTGLAHDGGQTLLEKCDGLPLALGSVAGYFRGEAPTVDDYKKLCNKLGCYLHDNNPDPVVAMATRGLQRDHFKDLRHVLMDNYSSLSTRTLRNSLLYLGIFPDARHLINRNKIIGRWVAEGYAAGNHSRAQQEQADMNFQLLVGMTIIQPVGISTGRMCKAPGIVHEFVLDMSRSKNFIRRTFDTAEQSSASTPERGYKRVRHFVVRGSNTICSGAAGNMDLSHIRSMTVLRAVTDNGDNLGSGGARQGSEVGHRSGSEGDAFLKFSKYKVIRVLDLEECAEVNNSYVENICKLWNLRYLSLGDNVNKVPKEISQLKLLERLHLSKTVMTVLPVDIIGMPSLIHLSGKFMLPGSEVSTDLVEESRESILETLSGIVADINQGFLQLVPKMKHLRKVKICFSQSSEPIVGLLNPLVAAIKGYLEQELNRSLGLDFSNLYETPNSRFPWEVMEDLYGKLSLGGNYYLTSLKLHLREELLFSMPQFIRVGENLRFLEKLFLSLTSVTRDLLSDISETLHMLTHLKLKADKIHMDLVIQDEKFQMLENLCFIVTEFCPKEDGSIPQIDVQGTLPKLRYLQLLCEELDDHRCCIDINSLEKLEEIELHAGLNREARQQWETAAWNHHNRPIVLPFLPVDDPARAPIQAAGAAQVVNDMPAAVAPAIIAPDQGAPQERRHAQHQVPVTTIGNATATVSHEHEIVSHANGETISASAKSVSSATIVQPVRDVPKNPAPEHVPGTSSGAHPVSAR